MIPVITMISVGYKSLDMWFMHDFFFFWWFYKCFSFKYTVNIPITWTQKNKIKINKCFGVYVTESTYKSISYEACYYSGSETMIL